MHPHAHRPPPHSPPLPGTLNALMRALAATRRRLLHVRPAVTDGHSNIDRLLLPGDRVQLRALVGRHSTALEPGLTVHPLAPSPLPLAPPSHPRTLTPSHPRTLSPTPNHPRRSRYTVCSPRRIVPPGSSPGGISRLPRSYSSPLSSCSDSCAAPAALPRPASPLHCRAPDLCSSECHGVLLPL